MMKQFSIVFRNRDFTTKLAIQQTLQIDRYSWNMIGGPKAAYLLAPNDGYALELLKLLRCPIEIYAGDGRLVWWGYVNRVVIPYGANMVGTGLDAMYNAVKVAWSDGSTNGVTTAAADVISVSEFGTKEYVYTAVNTDVTTAEALRDQYLFNKKYPKPEIEFSGGRDQVNIECKGWFDTLDWRFYENTGTDNVDDTNQVVDMISVSGQFFSGCELETGASGLTSKETRDGKSTAFRYITDLLSAGTDNMQPLLAKVDKDRLLHVYERSAEPIEGKTDYVLHEDGNLFNNVDVIVPPEWCVCAAWVQVKGAISTLTGMGSMRPFFIESSEYLASQDRVTYRPADAFEQRRLAKFIEDTASHTSSRVPSSVAETPTAAPYFIRRSSYVNNLSANTDTTLSWTTSFEETNLDPTSLPAGVYMIDVVFASWQVASPSGTWAFWLASSDGIILIDHTTTDVWFSRHYSIDFAGGNYSSLVHAVHVQCIATSLSTVEGGGSRATMTISLISEVSA